MSQAVSLQRALHRRFIAHLIDNTPLQALLLGLKLTHLPRTRRCIESARQTIGVPVDRREGALRLETVD
ncbi:MAG: hypothetical protein AAFR79_03120 [Pseudomonadota bacterium]